MKKTAILLIGIVLLSITNTNAFAQKAFKGILTYTIEYSGEIEPAEVAQQPTEMTIMIRDNKSKMEIIQGGGMVIIGQIVNGNDGSAISLINIASMGMKFYIKTTKEQMEAESAEDVPAKVNLTDETKEICGFEATKAEYITEDEYGDEVTTIVWFSTVLGGEALNAGGQFEGLPGIPLEYSMTIDEVTTTFTVTEIQKGKVKASDFLIPEDYEEKTQEELEQMFGGE